jgi:hypothetical protein
MYYKPIENDSNEHIWFGKRLVYVKFPVIEKPKVLLYTFGINIRAYCFGGLKTFDLVPNFLFCFEK